MATSQLFVMRHGEAEFRAARDDLRALTERGRAEVAAVAKQHLSGQHFDMVYVSPYLRAQQSWEVIQQQGVKFDDQITAPWVTPDESPQRAIDQLLLRHTKPGRILIVCHQPFVGRLTTLLCDGEDMGMPIATAGLVTMETEVFARQCATLCSVVAP